jgi:putative membrane protein
MVLASALPVLAVVHRRGGLLILLLLLAIVGLLVWLVVRSKRSGNTDTKSAREVLAERYARGEIDTEEYRTRSEQLK